MRRPASCSNPHGAGARHLFRQVSAGIQVDPNLRYRAGTPAVDDEAADAAGIRDWKLCFAAQARAFAVGTQLLFHAEAGDAAVGG